MLRIKQSIAVITCIVILMFTYTACSDSEAPLAPDAGIEPASTANASGQETIAAVVAEYYAPLAQFPPQIAALPEELSGLAAELDLSTADFVVATVDGWPIMTSELILRAWEEFNITGDYELELLLNKLVEEKAALSEAAALGVLPSREEIIAYQDQQVGDITQDPEMAVLFEQSVADHAAKLGISVEDYWQVLSPYHYHIFMALQNVWQVRRVEAQEAGRDADGANTTWAEDYAEEKRLEWKQQVTYEQVTDVPVLQFTPDLNQLFK